MSEKLKPCPFDDKEIADIIENLIPEIKDCMELHAYEWLALHFAVEHLRRADTGNPATGNDHIGDATKMVKPIEIEVIKNADAGITATGNEPLTLECFELICEAVHNGWWAEKIAQGVTDHPDMLPYPELAENVKDYDRVTVRRVLDALGVSYSGKPEKDGAECD